MITSRMLSPLRKTRVLSICHATPTHTAQRGMKHSKFSGHPHNSEKESHVKVSQWIIKFCADLTSWSINWNPSQPTANNWATKVAKKITQNVITARVTIKMDGKKTKLSSRVKMPTGYARYLPLNRLNFRTLSWTISFQANQSVLAIY